MIITGIFFICFAVLSFAGDDFRLLNYSFREDSTKSEYKRDGWYGYLYDLYTVENYLFIIITIKLI